MQRMLFCMAAPASQYSGTRTMRTIRNQPEDLFLGGWNLLLGAGLVVAPWYFGFTSETVAATNAWVSGAIVMALAILTMKQTYAWEEYAIAAAGAWSCMAPWLLGFEEAPAATWPHVGFGIALIVAAASELWRLRDAPSAYEI